MAQSHHRVIIIGAGSAGLCTAYHLQKIGINDFILLEKGEGLGGTWFWNQYPGAECDVQSHLYSFSFEPNPNWSRPFAGQEEILRYFNHIADKYDIRRRITFNTEISALNWQDDDAQWRVTTADGSQYTADIVVSAIGMFNNIVWPNIEGLDSFKGNYWHSARWNKAHDISNERVGVIGIAASAIQFVPQIAPQVEQLNLYQRTANWVVPKDNAPYTEEQLASFCDNPKALEESRQKIYDVWNTLATFDDKDVLASIEAAGLERIAEVKDPVVREKLTPNHPFGCKRPLFSDLYYPVFNRDNVDLITSDIDHITENAIVTKDGEKREVDTIIYSTGFYTTSYLQALEVTGRDGIHIKDAWSDGAQAYLGVNTTGFPNLFMLYGPNTNQGCILFMLERQVEYAMRQIQRIENEQLAWLDIKKDVMDSFNNKIQQDIANVDVWQAECGNDFYYRANSGRFVTQWPHSMDAFTEHTQRPNPEAYDVQRS